MQITNETLDTLDMSKVVAKCSGCDKPNISKPSGREFYRLLAYISLQCPDNTVLADVGTRYGASAFSLAYNEKVKVKTFDVVDNGVNCPSNVTFLRHDLTQDIEPVLDADLILIDVEPHDASKEQQMLQKLLERGWSGYLLFDDIDWPRMKSWWANIDGCVNITRYGHATGTGLLVLGQPKLTIEFN